MATKKTETDKRVNKLKFEEMDGRLKNSPSEGDITRKPLNDQKKKKNEDLIYKAVDFFAGIGGIRLGFQQAFGNKIKFVYANEINPYSCETYKANFGDDPTGDITKVVPTQLPDFDILMGGFPCQAFSIAGHKRGFDDTRGTLFFYIAEILRVKKPQAFLLENVKHLKNHDKGRTLQVIRDVLTKDLHYNIHIQVLNAKEFGVPQNRERIFIVGFKKNLKFEFPIPPKTKVSLHDILEPKGTVDPSFYLSHEYLTGLKKHRARHEAKGNGFGYQVIPRNNVANAIVCGGMGKERNLVNDNILPECWKKEGDDKQLRNEEGIRKMTPREWARLQGFPDSFTFPVSKTRKYRQLGNSVAVPVIQAIAEKIKETLIGGNIINEEYILSPAQNNILTLLIRMYEKKALPKTGKKNIPSIKRFIEENYLRILHFNEILLDMKDFGIITKRTEKTIQISPQLLGIESKDKFTESVVNMFKSTYRQMNNPADLNRNHTRKGSIVSHYVQRRLLEPKLK
jgi:DNA (cytosine-5)-methyltransferase 1